MQLYIIMIRAACLSVWPIGCHLLYAVVETNKIHTSSLQSPILFLVNVVSVLLLQMDDINLHHRFLNWRRRIREREMGEVRPAQERFMRLLKNGDILRYAQLTCDSSEKKKLFLIPKPNLNSLILLSGELIIRHNSIIGTIFLCTFV